MATVIRKEQLEERSTVRPSLIGEWLRSAGRLTDEDIGKIVSLQRQRNIRFGEAAIELGLLTEADLHHALSQQFDFAYAEIGTSTLDESLHVAYDPYCAYSEAIRTLRSQLNLRWFATGRTTLAVIEGRSGDGCSRVAANLAIAFSQAGTRTLLVDANLRAPTQCRLFGLNTPDGLSGLLAGRTSLIQAMAEVPAFSRLRVLCAGASVPNPQEMLSRPAFATLLQTLSSSFEVVIVDCPPLLESADAQLIAARCGGCLLVARQDHTRLEDIQKTRQQLEPSGALVLGATLIGG